MKQNSTKTIRWCKKEVYQGEHFKGGFYLMRKTTKKVLSASLIATLAVSMMACGSKDTSNSDSKADAQTKEDGTTSSDSKDNAKSDVEKPSKITVMCDGTVMTEDNGRAQFESALEAALGLDIQFIQPDHSSYSDVLQQTITGGEWPDVVIIPATYYQSYAKQGVLWDMSDAWENSDLKASGRVDERFVDCLYIDDEDIKGLFGMSATRGNGCVTYVKQQWLDDCGIAEVPTTYDEYIDMLRKFKEVKGTYAVSAAGLISKEAPYTNYLPEFYQDAYPDFYEKDGKYVDGFTEDAMKEALQRLQDAYTEGLIDPTAVTNKTSDCRTKFYDDQFGVFTYWAGTWANNLSTNLEANGKNGDIVAMKPIKELGKYVERQSPVWAITTQCKNPEGVYKYFFETMLDGGEVQTLWTYGVKGVHWDTKAETVTWGDKSKDYAEGEFHMLPSLEDSTKLFAKNHIDSTIVIDTWVDSDPGAKSIPEVSQKSAEVFNENSVIANVAVSNDIIAQNSGDIWTCRANIVAEVVTGSMTVEEGMAKYEKEVGDLVEDCLKSLNK